VENDVHILGVSSLAAGHKTLVPSYRRTKKYGREDIMVVVGGVIPAQDYQYLFDAEQLRYLVLELKLAKQRLKFQYPNVE
jgi:methylmalonyl-CoA mutase